MSLTFQRVHYIRTSGERDAALARRWRLTSGAIRDARTGKTWAEHPAPVDTAPRAHRGNWND